MIEQLRYTKYAAELSVLDLGKNVIFRHIKKYKYRGEQREKVVTMYKPNYVQHSVTLSTGNASVSMRYAKKPTDSYAYEWAYLNLDATIAVYDLVKE